MGLLAAVALGFTLFFLPAIVVLTALVLFDDPGTPTRRPPGAAHLLPACVAAAVTFGLLVGLALPRWGMMSSLSIVTVLCLAAAGLALVRAVLALAAVVTLVAGLVVVAVLVASAPPAGPHAHGLVALQHTGQRELRVLDHGDWRWLLVDGEPAIGVDRATGDAEAPDPSSVELMLQFFWPPGRVLLVGLPEARLVRALVDRGWRVDVAADAMLLDLAQEHLLLDAALYTRLPPETFLRALLHGGATDRSDTYELIVVQLRIDARAPQTFATRRGLRTLRRWLAPDGILVSRLQVPGWRHPWAGAVACGFLETFPEVWALPVSGGPLHAGALVLVGAERPLEIRDHLLPAPQDHPGHPDAQLQSGRARNAWRYRFVPDFDTALCLELHDNAAPWWLETFHRSDRRRLHHRLGGHTFTW